MGKIQDERFARCETAEENMRIYKDAVREVNQKNYPETERNERIEMERLLAIYRADISSHVPIPTNPQIPILISKPQEERLKELVKKYDDPQKLKKGLAEKVKNLVGEVAVFVSCPADQVARWESRKTGNDAYKHLFSPAIYNFHQKMESDIREANKELTDELIRDMIQKGEKLGDEKPGLKSYLSPSQNTEQDKATEAEKGTEAKDSLDSNNGLKRAIPIPVKDHR